MPASTGLERDPATKSDTFLAGFSRRHIGPTMAEQHAMLRDLGYSSLDDLSAAAVPKGIQLQGALNLPAALTEHQALDAIREIARRNVISRSMIGMGYKRTLVPAPIQRNILENPGWYTQYTPYQAEIAQGRLEALLNFQTMIAELTGFPIANASLLDEGTAAAEAMGLCLAVTDTPDRRTIAVDQACFPQTIAVVTTRAKALGVTVEVVDFATAAPKASYFALLVQYPGADGRLATERVYGERFSAYRTGGAMVICATSPMALTLLKSPAELGADVAIGSAQEFGIPMGFGGPHAAYMATKDEHKRRMPGRLVGVTKDRLGNSAIRLALQTREQHIRRDKATSNICTAQVLLAIMSGMYAVYHGPQGLRGIARAIHARTVRLASALKQTGASLLHDSYFDTIAVTVDEATKVEIRRRAEAQGLTFWYGTKNVVSVTIDEATSSADIDDVVAVFAPDYKRAGLDTIPAINWPADLTRRTEILQHPVFNSFHSEPELTRYIARLEAKDLSLKQSMIPLGSCTMKLNAVSELYPVSWPEFGGLHPLSPTKFSAGYEQLGADLCQWLGEITGFSGVSLQPNSGAQGEFAGLLVIRQYLEQHGKTGRNVCLIPASAHGTNPASAVLAGFSVVVVRCDENGNIDLDDLRSQVDKHAAKLGALMITYPSTHGVFEAHIKEICEYVHRAGGQVYMDGANMNAQVGLCRPGDYGPDVCHINLHKTFCIPHGGGGPGMGPIAVKAHLVPYLPKDPVSPVLRDGETHTVGQRLSADHSSHQSGAVSAAAYGSASILPVSWMYIRMMGPDGLKRATQVAILNANYVAQRLDRYYPLLFKGHGGLVAHECIVDLRPLKQRTGVDVEDVAKRLMDYGFHAPTVSFPVPGTLMIEPTESESKAELDRFCDAMIAIHGEIQEIADGKADPKNNLLKNAPHPVREVTASSWDQPYSRERAAFPLPWVAERKFWPAVARLDSAYGDRNFMCTCPPVSAY